MSKIRYIETYPDEINKIFDSLEEYSKFQTKRFEEVYNILYLNNPLSKYKYSDWKHESFRLNKDGTPRKYNPAKHLQTKKSRKKQEIKFKEYLERKNKEKKESKENKEFSSNWIFVEWGFKAHEKGWNLEKTREEFIKIIR